jgi:hypothetical protein
VSTRPDDVLTVRLAGPADRPALERLAGRDSGSVPDGETVIAVVDGEVRAAIALACGTVIADPFRPTAELVDLLRLRAAQLRRRRIGQAAKVRRAPVGGLRAGLTGVYTVVSSVGRATIGTVASAPADTTAAKT